MELDFFISLLKEGKSTGANLNQSLLDTYILDTKIFFSPSKLKSKSSNIDETVRNIQKTVSHYANNLDEALESTNLKFRGDNENYLNKTDLAFALGNRLAYEFNHLTQQGYINDGVSTEERYRMLNYLLIAESIFANTPQIRIDKVAQDLVPIRISVVAIGYLLSFSLLSSGHLFLGLPSLAYTLYKSYQSLESLGLLDKLLPSALRNKAHYFKGIMLSDFFQGVKDYVATEKVNYSAQYIVPDGHTQSLSRRLPLYRLQARNAILRILSQDLSANKIAKLCKNSSIE